ncbi:MAG TPA: hypothetical protein ENH11_09535 [Candidatus Acetothermia bacterium]|nr:hypothetical protein [Candidatus Acetothermia bacterium]
MNATTSRRMILVQPASKGGYKYIRMLVKGATLEREWGLAQGKSQSTSNTYKALNVGKVNEKSPKQVALEDYERVLKKKTEEGYREVTLTEFEKICAGGSREDHSSEMDVIDFDSPPTSFAVSKPIAKITDKKLQKLLDVGNAIVQMKENGLCHWIFVGTAGKIRIFTRRMDDHTSKYPELVAYLEELEIPNKSVLACEIVIVATGRGHLHDFKLVCGISRADTVKGKLKFVDGDDGYPHLPKTEARIKANGVRAMVFTILWWGGEVWHDKPYSKIFEKLTKEFSDKISSSAAYGPEARNYPPGARVGGLHADAKKNRVWREGYVIWDRNASVEVSFTGKPKRRACYKLKPTQETDVIVVSVESGKGKRQGKVASLNLAAYDENGKLVDLGKCGSGLTDESAEPSFWEDLPCVIQIEYAEQFETGKFQFPVFIMKHGDKQPKEVTI